MLENPRGVILPVVEKSEKVSKFSIIQRGQICRVRRVVGEGGGGCPPVPSGTDGQLEFKFANIMITFCS